MKERDVTFDMMKGIAILAMIAGHCFIPHQLHHFVYIWHMPLFFFVSGYFFKEKPLQKVIAGIWKGLLVPYIVTGITILLCLLLCDCLWGTDLLKSKGVALFAVNGLLSNPDTYGGVYKCAPIWFLLALGWCKIIYSILEKLKFNVVLETILLAGLSYSIACCSDKIYMPFFIQQALVSLIFYHVGFLFKRNINSLVKYKRIAFGLGMLALAVGMFQGRMDIWALLFPNRSLNICAAIGSVVLLYFVLKFKYFTPPHYSV